VSAPRKDKRTGWLVEDAPIFLKVGRFGNRAGWSGTCVSGETRLQIPPDVSINRAFRHARTGLAEFSG
jgi:hypothetical protein